MNTRKLQRANISTDLFFVATCQVKGDNELHLIQVSTEASNNAAASATSSAAHNAKLATQCLKIFRCDYGEIVHMAAHLTNPDRLFIVGARKTVLVDMSAGSNATTTTRNETDEGGSTPADTEASTNSVDTLTVRHEFINDASSSVRQVLWHPDESNEDLVARLTTKAVEVVKLGANDNTPTFRRVVIDADQCDQLHWNPHRLSEIAYAHGKSLIGVDTRQTGSQTAWRIDDADTLRLKTFDFNVSVVVVLWCSRVSLAMQPNALHSLCCGGVDGMVRFYDVRTTAQPVLRLSGNHEHWVRCFVVLDVSMSLISFRFDLFCTTSSMIAWCCRRAVTALSTCTTSTRHLRNWNTTRARKRNLCRLDN
jgi:hypothetical protein